ncbi:hypothetical protein SELMODRAFT_427157 [Selaginella moellendorffii]|uniref:Uncharacterized protein n=1 Tax=Selaginella moellendorffii TaxID=88036 RepID=D8SYP7_SELML|nr:hypothetical protein SELMODRAFT_427157 [Selaginella moellendorffii]
MAKLGKTRCGARSAPYETGDSKSKNYQVAESVSRLRHALVYDNGKVLHVWDMERGFCNYKLPYPSQIKGHLCGVAGGILFFKENSSTQTIFAWNPVTGFVKEINLPSVESEFLVIVTPKSHRLCKLNPSLKLEAVGAPPVEDWTRICYLGERFNGDSGIKLECSRHVMYANVLGTSSLQQLDVLATGNPVRTISSPRPFKGRSFHLPRSAGSVKYRFFQLEQDVFVCVSMQRRLHSQGCVRIWLYKPGCHGGAKSLKGSCHACRVAKTVHGSHLAMEELCACSNNEDWEDVSKLPDKYVQGLLKESISQDDGAGWFAFGMANIVLVAFVSKSGDLSSCKEVFRFELALREWTRVANPFRSSRGVNWNNMSCWCPSSSNLDMDWGLCP